MKGWKTKAGAWTLFVASLCEAAYKLIPNEECKPYLMFFAMVLGAAGAGLMGLGLGHKIEKAAERIRK